MISEEFVIHSNFIHKQTPIIARMQLFGADVRFCFWRMGWQKQKNVSALDVKSSGAPDSPRLCGVSSPSGGLLKVNSPCTVVFDRSLSASILIIQFADAGPVTVQVYIPLLGVVSAIVE